MCTSEEARDSTKDEQRIKRSNIKKATREEDGHDSEPGSDSEYFIGHMLRIKKVGGTQGMLQVMIASCKVQVEPDTGAEINVMDEHQYQALKDKRHGYISAS